MWAAIRVALAVFICLPVLATAAEKHDDAEKKAVESAEAWSAWSIKASTATPGIRRPNT